MRKNEGIKTSQVADRKPYLTIKPKKSWQFFDFREIKEYRDLFWLLILRDVRVRYKQTVLGGLWAIIQPLFMMLIFSLFFGNLAKVPSDGVPYPIFSYSAMVIWTYFSNAITNSANSLILESSLISKVYFPRVLNPLAAVFAGLLDFGIALSLLVGMIIFYGIHLSVTILLIPLLLILMVMLAAGTGLFLAALNAKYRDIRYTLTFLMQLWMFISPVVYPFSLVPTKFRFLYSLNPMAGIIEGFRAALLGTGAVPWMMLLSATVVSLLFLLAGALYFKQTERYFADII